MLLTPASPTSCLPVHPRSAPPLPFDAQNHGKQTFGYVLSHMNPNFYQTFIEVWSPLSLSFNANSESVSKLRIAGRSREAGFHNVHKQGD